MAQQVDFFELMVEFRVYIFRKLSRGGEPLKPSGLGLRAFLFDLFPDHLYMSWIQTYSGHSFDPLAPEAGSIAIDDIAHALSMTCRFNGHCRSFYSVAEHSIWVSEQTETPKLALYGLLHDAAEAYVSDVGHPVKSALPDFSRVENGILMAVAERFDLPANFAQQVRQVDLRMLATEKEQLMSAEAKPWPILDNVQPYQLSLPCWRPTEARRRFTERLNRLMDVM